MDYAPLCLEPTGVTSSAVTKNAATISWTAPLTLPSNGYQYEVRSSGAAGSGATGLVGSGNTITSVLTANITGLTPETVYSVYVRSDCGMGNFSNWTTAITFKTMCDYADVTGISGARCGVGAVSLGATSIGTIKWYSAANGGTSIGTGATWNTPSINATTTFYASASSGATNFSAGLPDNTGPYGTFGDPGSTTYGLYFTTTNTLTINSVYVYPMASGSCTIQLQDGVGALIAGQTTTVTFAAGDVGIKTLVALNFVVPAAGSYRLMNTAGVDLGRFNPYSGPAYPLTYGGVLTITQGSLGTGTYYDFFDWSIFVGCESARIPVVATINQPTAINASASAPTICAGQTTNLNVSSADAGYAYTWNPGAITGAGPHAVTPATTTTYTVIANNAATSCVNEATVTVTVNPLPSALTATSSTASACAGSAFDLFSTSNSNSAPVIGNYLLPTFDGGFDMGATLALNNWGEANGTDNIWTVGTAAGVHGGTNAAYSGVGFVNTGVYSINYMYKDVVIPAGQTNLSLQFYIKMPATDPGYDGLIVLTTTPANTPTADVDVYGDAAYSTLAVYTSTAYANYTLQTVSLPNALSGTTVRLVFQWIQDGYSPIVSVAVDNVSVTSSTPLAANYSWTSNPAGFTSAIQNPAGVTQTATTEYVVHVSNSYGCTAKDSVNVNYVLGAAITSEPITPVIKCAGQTATFTVVSDGPDLVYHWKKDGVNIPVATNATAMMATLSLSNVTAADNGMYSVAVIASCGDTAFSTVSHLTVNPTPTVSASVVTPICSGLTLQLSGSSDLPGITYHWAGPNGFTSNVQNPEILSATPVASGVYTLTASLDGCTSTAATTSAVVNQSPSALTIIPSVGYASGEIQPLAVAGGTIESMVLLSEDFNGSAAGWIAINNSTGGNFALAAWTLEPDAHVYSSITYHSNDNSQFFMSNADAAGSGIALATILQSPVFSTAGALSANLSFYQYFRYMNAANVEYSLDGTTWVNFASFSATVGSAAGFVQENIALPAGALNQPTVSIRFAYNGGWDWYWAIDNVSIITGSQQSDVIWSPITSLYIDDHALYTYDGVLPSTTVYTNTNVPITYVATATSPNGCASTASVEFLPNTKPLSIKVLIEGLYAGSGLMNQAMGAAGAQFAAGVADVVTVELHDANAPFAVVKTFTDVDLLTDGTIAIGNILHDFAGSYYMVIKHRNSIETWSTDAFDFSGTGPFDYDFTNDAAKAYGNNLKPVSGGFFAVWAGEAYQDGVVDGSDMAVVDNASTGILVGYNVEDVNGDGFVDGSDMAIIDNNSTAIVHVIKP